MAAVDATAALTFHRVVSCDLKQLPLTSKASPVSLHCGNSRWAQTRRRCVSTPRASPNATPGSSPAAGTTDAATSSPATARAPLSPAAEGDATSKEVLDAFFLGRAVAEVVLERVGSAVGEFLSDISRAQAEQQQQIRELQEEVQKRALEAQQKARGQ